MSQTTFLEDVFGWSEQKCEDNLEETLPKLIICLGDTSSLEESIGILKIICQTFLPLVKKHEAEEKVFSKISRLTCLRFDEIIEKITEHTSGNADVPQISSLLEMAFNVLDCLDYCIKSVASYGELHICHVHSLPSCTIHLLKGTYSHCKSSAECYQDLLGTLSESLSMLFRKAHTVQMAFLNMFDKVIARCSENDAHDLCEVCEGLFEVCQIVTSLDVKVVVSIWKAVSRISSLHKDILKKTLNVFKIITFLCQEIKSGYEYLFHLVPEGGLQGDEKSFKKSVKILGFYMKILVVFVKDYKEVFEDCVTDLFNLMLDILKMLPPCLSRPEIADQYTNEIKLNIGDAVGPLLEHLMSNRDFTKCVTHQDTNVDKALRLPRLLLQIQILDILPKYSDDVQSCWLQPSLSTEDSNQDDIVTAAFRSVGQCFVELALPVYMPGVISTGKQPRDVSLYEYVCTHMCGFIGSYPAKYFPVLETSLLQNAFSTNPFVSLMTADCWCFLVRYGSSELCNAHVSLLCHLHKRIYSSDLMCLKMSQLGVLVHRLAKFLAPEHQQELLKVFVPSDNLGLWAVLPLAAMHSRTVPDLMEELVTSSIKTLHNWTTGSNQKQKDIPRVVVALRCLNNIFSNPAFVERYILPNRQLVVTKVCELWRLLAANDWYLSTVLSFLISVLLSLSSLLMSCFQTSHIVQILTVIQNVLTQQAPVLIKLSVVNFLEKCGSLNIPPSFQQSQILNKIPEVFRTVLLDSNCVVHHEAISAFTRFAEQTVHESVVPQCIGNNTHLQQVVVAFLNKVPYQEGKHTVDKLEYFSAQMDAINRPQNDCYPDTFESVTEPPCKRLKRDICPQTEDDYKKVLEKFQSVFTDLQQLSLINRPPEWFLQSGGVVLEQMIQIFNKNTVVDKS